MDKLEYSIACKMADQMMRALDSSEISLQQKGYLLGQLIDAQSWFTILNQCAESLGEDKIESSAEMFFEHIINRFRTNFDGRKLLELELGDFFDLFDFDEVNNTQARNISYEQ